MILSITYVTISTQWSQVKSANCVHTPSRAMFRRRSDGKRRISMLTFSEFFSLKGTALKGIVLLDARGKH